MKMFSDDFDGKNKLLLESAIYEILECGGGGVQTNGQASCVLSAALTANDGLRSSFSVMKLPPSRHSLGYSASLPPSPVHCDVNVWIS